MINEKTPSEELLKIAIKSAVEIARPHEKFIVRDLFKVVDWKHVKRLTRKELGLKFYDYVVGEGSDMFETFDKTSENPQRYRKLLPIN